MAPTYDDGLIPDYPPSDLESLAPPPPPPPPPFSDKPQHQLTVSPVQKPRTICGIRRITFLLLAIIGVLVIVGAVGGGVGGSLALKNAQNSENLALNSASTSALAVASASTPSAVTVTVTASTSTLPTQSPVTAAQLTCPDDNNTTYTAANGGQFTITCDENFPNSDLQMIDDTLNLDDCIENCAYFNRLKPSVPCVGVVFTPSANYCWLKSYFGASSAGSDAWAAECIGCQSN